jgi:hypothetical protein
MSTNTFLTTRTTTLASLGAVAYGSSSFYFFVQDQIRGSNPLYDLHRSRPSALFLDMLGSREVFVEYIAELAQVSNIYSKLHKLYPDKISSREGFAEHFLRIFLRELDNLTRYSVFVMDFLDGCLDILVKELSMGETNYIPDGFSKLLLSGLDGYGTDISNFKEVLAIIFDNPNAKLDDAPADRLIKLRRGLSTEFNHKGLTKARVEIPISQWQQDFAYRDMKVFQEQSARLVVTENYDGYGIDQVLNPEIINGLSTKTLSSDEAGVKDYTPPPSNRNRLSEGEQRVVDFDLINAPVGVVEV